MTNSVFLIEVQAPRESSKLRLVAFGTVEMGRGPTQRSSSCPMTDYEYNYVMTEKCANKLDVVFALRDAAKRSFSVVESLSALVATSTVPPNRRIRIDQCLRSEVN